MKASVLAAAISMLSVTLIPATVTAVQAAELTVLAGGSIAGPLNELKTQFERDSGHRLTIHFDSTPNLIKLVTSDAPFR